MLSISTFRFIIFTSSAMVEVRSNRAAPGTFVLKERVYKSVRHCRVASSAQFFLPLTQRNSRLSLYRSVPSKRSVLRTEDVHRHFLHFRSLPRMPLSLKPEWFQAIRADPAR